MSEEVNKNGDNGVNALSGKERVPDDDSMGWDLLMRIRQDRLITMASAAANARKVDEQKVNELQKLFETLTTLGGVLEECVLSGTMTPSEARFELNRSPIVAKINKLLVELGLVELVLKGDWKVSRISEVWDRMGTVGYRELERIYEEFVRHHYGNGVIDAEINSGHPLTHLEIGCGNGILLEGAFGTKSWRRIGYADKIYYSLNDQLRSLLIDPEAKENPAILEFIDLVSTLITRAIFYLKASGGKPNPQMETLLKMAENPNIIMYVLKDLEHYFPGFLKMKDFIADDEHLAEYRIDIGKNCRELIEEYCHDSDKFLSKYFVSDIFSEPETSEIVEAEIKQEVLAFSQEIEKLEREIDLDKDNGGIGAGDRETIIGQKRQEISRLRDLVRELKNALFRSGTGVADLSRKLCIFPRKILLGKFREFGAIFADENGRRDRKIFDIATGFRALSHADEKEYEEFLYEVAIKLKPGGIIEDDGVRESYTREFRVKALERLQKRLGPDYKISFVVKDKGPEPLTVFVERAMVSGDQRYFFTEYAGNRILRGEDKKLMPLSEFYSRFKILSIQDEIVRRVKALFEEAADHDANLAKAYLRGIRGIINRELKQVFMENWETVDDLLAAGVDNPSVFDEIIGKIPVIRERLDALRANEPPMSFTDVFGAYKADEHYQIEDPNTLPKGEKMPLLSDPEGQKLRETFMKNLQQIEQITGEPPLNLVELGGCFTNGAMRDLLEEIFGSNENKYRLLKIHRIYLSSSEQQYPPVKDNNMYIVGGSLDSVLEGRGSRFVSEWVSEVSKAIRSGRNITYTGTGYGAQALAKAEGLPVKRRSGQFGVFQAVICDSEFWGEEGRENRINAGASLSATNIRTAYPRVPEDRMGDVDVFMAEGVDDSGIIKPDPQNPLAISMQGGKEIGVMSSLELRVFSRERDAERLALGQKNFEHAKLPTYKGYTPTGHESQDNGVRDVVAFLFLFLLNRQAESLLKDIQRKTSE